MANKPFSKLAAVGFVADVFISIALPTAGFALLGRYLDKRWGLSPWMTILSFFPAIAVSGFLVYRKATRYTEEMKQPKP